MVSFLDQQIPCDGSISYGVKWCEAGRAVGRSVGRSGGRSVGRAVGLFSKTSGRLMLSLVADA